MIVALLNYYCSPIQLYWVDIMVLIAAFISATESADT